MRKKPRERGPRPRGRKSRLEELIGYDRERGLLIENTEQFLAGFPANNVLLYGERGTGKSSTVKALLHAYGDRGLRLVEVPKHLLADFPQILAQVRDRRERFVFFVDDLSFEEHESIYKELKAVLEGGLEARPANVVVYATSNRRHLIVERFSALPLVVPDRDDHIHAAELRNHCRRNGVQIGVAQGGSGNVERDTDQLLNSFARTNPDLRATGNARRDNIGGRSGLTTPLSNVSEVTGEREYITLSTVSLRDRSLLYIIAVAPAPQASQYEPAFRRIRQSVEIAD